MSAVAWRRFAEDVALGVVDAILWAAGAVAAVGVLWIAANVIAPVPVVTTTRDVALVSRAAPVVAEGGPDPAGTAAPVGESDTGGGGDQGGNESGGEDTGGEDTGGDGGGSEDSGPTSDEATAQRDDAEAVEAADRTRERQDEGGEAREDDAETLAEGDAAHDRLVDADPDDGLSEPTGPNTPEAREQRDLGEAVEAGDRTRERLAESGADAEPSDIEAIARGEEAHRTLVDGDLGDALAPATGPTSHDGIRDRERAEAVEAADLTTQRRQRGELPTTPEEERREQEVLRRGAREYRALVDEAPDDGIGPPAGSSDPVPPSDLNVSSLFAYDDLTPEQRRRDRAVAEAVEAEDRRLERLADPEQVDGPPLPRRAGDTHALANELADTTLEDVDDAAAIEAAGAAARVRAAERYPDASDEDLAETSRQAEVRERLTQTGDAPTALPGDVDAAQVPDGYARDRGGTEDPSDDVWVPAPAGATRIVEEGPGRRERPVRAGYRDAPPGGADLDVAGEEAREGLPPLRRGLLDTERAELFERTYTESLARHGGDVTAARAEARAASDALNIHDVDLNAEVAGARTSAAIDLRRRAGADVPETELDAARDEAEAQVRLQYPQLADDRPVIAGTTPPGDVPDGWIADDGGTADPRDDVYRPAPPRTGGTPTSWPGHTPAEDLPPGAVLREGGPGPGDERWVLPADDAPAADLGVAGDEALRGLEPRREALLITERAERYEDVYTGARDAGASEQDARTQAQEASDALNAYGLDLNGQAAGERVRAAIAVRERAAAQGRTASPEDLEAARDAADDDLVGDWFGVPVTPRTGTRDVGGAARSLGGWEAVTVGVAGPDGATDVDACGTLAGPCTVAAGIEDVGDVDGATGTGPIAGRAPLEARLVRPDGTVDAAADDAALGLLHDDHTGGFLGSHAGAGEVRDRDGRRTRSTAGGLIEAFPGVPAAITADGTGEVRGVRGDGATFDGTGSRGGRGAVSMIDSEDGGPAVISGDGLAAFRPFSADGTVGEVRGFPTTDATFVAGGAGERDEMVARGAGGWFFRPQENLGVGGYGGDGATVSVASEDGAGSPLDLMFTGRGWGDNAEGDRFAVTGTGPAARGGVTTFVDRDDRAGGPLTFATDDTGPWVFRPRTGETLGGDDPGRLPDGRALSPVVLSSDGWLGRPIVVAAASDVDAPNAVTGPGSELGAPGLLVPDFGSGPAFTVWGLAIDAVNNRVRAVGTLQDAATRHRNGARWADRQLGRVPGADPALRALGGYEARLAARYADLAANLEQSRDRFGDLVSRGTTPGVADGLRRFEDFSRTTAFDRFNRRPGVDEFGRPTTVMGPRPLEFVRRGGTKIAGFGGVGLASVDVLYGLGQGESLAHSVGRAGSSLVVGAAGGGLAQAGAFRVVRVPAAPGAALGPYAAGVGVGLYVGDLWGRSGAAGRSGETLDRTTRALREDNPGQAWWVLRRGSGSTDELFTAQVGEDLTAVGAWLLAHGFRGVEPDVFIPPVAAGPPPVR